MANHSRFFDTLRRSPRRGPLREVSSPSRLRRTPAPEANLSDSLITSFFHTPPNEQVIHRRTLTALTSPIKCLQDLLESGEEVDDTNTDVFKKKLEGTKKRLLLSPLASPKPKKPRVQRKGKVALSKELQGITHEQLLSLVETLVERNPALEQEIHSLMPSPDLQPLEDKLEALRRNIYKSFPNSRWGSSRDAFCYRRVKTHLEVFKKTCTDQGRSLATAQSWESLIHYVLTAWGYVDQMPDWDDPSHNASKCQCFRNLAAMCMTALKKSKLEKEKYKAIKNRLQEAVETDSEIEPCVAQIDVILSKPQ